MRHFRSWPGIEARELVLFQAPFETSEIIAEVTDLFAEQGSAKNLELIYSIAEEVPVQLLTKETEERRQIARPLRTLLLDASVTSARIMRGYLTRWGMALVVVDTIPKAVATWQAAHATHKKLSLHLA